MAKNKRNSLEFKNLKESLQKEFTFINQMFSVLSVPVRMTDDAHNNADDYVYVNPRNSIKADNKDKVTKRAQNIVELQKRLEKIKQDNNYTLKNKLMKKSLTSKLNKKARETERKQRSKLKKKIAKSYQVKPDTEIKTEKNIVHEAKPVFNSDGKLVFSKFDFTNIGVKNEKKHKALKDPKKLLENLQKQEKTVKKLKESGETEKASEIQQKIAWKNALAKAEGEKVKDDPILLRKSIKKQDQKKKQSKKKWDERINSVEQGKQERQKKRQENIAKKKKEKKSKVMKKAVKKGRIVI